MYLVGKNAGEKRFTSGYTYLASLAKKAAELSWLRYSRSAHMAILRLTRGT